MASHIRADVHDEVEKEREERCENVHDANVAIIREAITAEQLERMGVLKALMVFPKATFWSFMVSFCIIMEAYDNSLIGNLMAQPAFQKKFGNHIGNERYQIPADWQSACNYASTVGAFIGILACGQLQPRFGYKKLTLVCLAVVTAFIFVPFFAETLPVLFAGEFLLGLPFGFFNAIAQAYASEIAPTPLRGMFTMYNQMCWSTGQLIAAGVLYVVSTGTTDWAYKIPFAIQWAWPVPIFAILCFAPESPWWLVRRGKLAQAESIIRRLEGGGSQRNPSDVIAMMQRTVEIELSISASASYLDMFKGFDLRRTVVALVIFAGQNLSGVALANQATYFYTIIGLDTQTSFALGIGTIGMVWVGIVISFWATATFGRRPLYMSGVIFQSLCMLLIGIIACSTKSTGGYWAQVVLVMVVFLSYGVTVGPLTFAIVAEVSSIKLRAKTCASARAFFYTLAVPFGFVSSYSLNPTAWNLEGKSAFIWLATGLVMLVFTYLLVPETKDRSWRELEILWHRGTPARKFKSTEVGVMQDE